MYYLICFMTSATALFNIYLAFFWITRGTFGVVKKVTHRASGECFAAKFLPLRSSTRTRAFQERDLLSRLAHRRLACLLDFFSTRRTLVLVVELQDFLTFFNQSIIIILIFRNHSLNQICQICSIIFSFPQMFYTGLTRSFVFKGIGYREGGNIDNSLNFSHPFTQK